MFETRARRIIDTLTWFPTRVGFLHTSSAETTIVLAQDMVQALQSLHLASLLSLLDTNENAILTTRMYTMVSTLLYVVYSSKILSFF